MLFQLREDSGDEDGREWASFFFFLVPQNLECHVVSSYCLGMTTAGKLLLPSRVSWRGKCQWRRSYLGRHRSPSTVPTNCQQELCQVCMVFGLIT